MKKVVSFLSLIVLLSAATPVSFANSPYPPKRLELSEMSEWETYNWEDKLKRAGWNLISFPMEMSYSHHKVAEERGKGAAWTIGVLEGLGRGVKRFFVGFVELFTFPFNFPDDDKGPLMYPEFVWERKSLETKNEAAVKPRT